MKSKSGASAITKATWRTLQGQWPAASLWFQCTWHSTSTCRLYLLPKLVPPNPWMSSGLYRQKPDWRPHSWYFDADTPEPILLITNCMMQHYIGTDLLNSEWLKPANTFHHPKLLIRKKYLKNISRPPIPGNHSFKPSTQFKNTRLLMRIVLKRL